MTHKKNKNNIPDHDADFGSSGSSRNQNRLKRFADTAASFGRTVFGEEKDEHLLIKPEEARLSNAPQRIIEAPKRAWRNIKKLNPLKKKKKGT